MLCKQIIKSFLTIISAGLLASVCMISSSQAAGESNCWMEEQLTLTDGGSPYFGCAVREQGVEARRADTMEHSVATPDKEDSFLDRQLRIAGG